MENVIEKNQMKNGVVDELQEVFVHEEIVVDEEVIENQNDEKTSNRLDTNESQTEVMLSEMRDFSRYQFSQQVTRCSSGTRTSGALSLVYAKTGNRVALSKEITGRLGQPKEVQLIYNVDEIIIGTNLIDECPKHKVSYQNGRGMIYSKPLVKELVDYYQIDFTDRTSCSLGSLSFGQDNYQNDSQPYAIITDIKLP